jgi:uncharacterized membrane protein YdjX (TVP38/TMEM64 family)
VSPSKKANKQDPIQKTKSAQQSTKKTSVRSSRVPIQKATPKTKQTASRSKANKNGGVNSPEIEINLTPTQVVQEETPNAPKSSNLRTNILRGLALAAVIAITLYIISIRDHVAEFKQYGYVGIFFVALLANATVFIPAPGVAIIYAMGAVFNPIYVGIAAGTGGAIGELSGFLAGFSGQAIVERTHIYERIKPWVEKYGGWAIFVLAAIPNPFFDIAGFAAGIAKMRMRTFLFSVWVGQLIKMTLFAYAGKYSIEWIANLIK